jgi:polyhydroxyalkanoate synthesis regulator phasin
MAQSNVLKRYLDAGMAFTAITQAKAEAIVKDLVKTGEVQAEQAQAVAADLLDRSRRNTEALVEQVSKQIAASAENLGLATLADLARVEKLIAKVRPAAKPAAAAKKAAPVKKAAAKKTPAKKAPAKKAAAKKAPAKKAAAKKAPAKKTATKKA